jgi:hypothetical protein
MSMLLLNNGFKGFIPTPMPTTDTTQIAQSRNTLVRAWNTTYKTDSLNTIGVIATPFRVVNNAGDILCRKNYSCGGSCQTPQSRPGIYGLSSRFGSIQYLCDGTQVSPTTCNVKYVYDGSDYTTYLKNKAILHNYNDISYGGNRSNGSQVQSKAIRRY